MTRIIFSQIQIFLKYKSKVHPRTGYEAPEGEQSYVCNIPSTSALDGCRYSTLSNESFASGKRHGTHFIRGSLNPKGWSV